MIYEPKIPVFEIPVDKKGFLIAAGDPIVMKYQSIFDSIDKEDNYNGLQIDLLPQGIVAGNTDTVREIMLAAQHYPKTLAKLLTNTKLSFINGDRTRMPPKMIEHWKQTTVFQKWLHHIFMQSPCFIFFLKNKTLRFHAIVGMFSLLDHTNTTFTVKGLSGVKFLKERKDEIAKSFYHAGISFIDYCTIAGIDPKPYMERVYEEMKHTNDYEKLFGIYNERIASDGTIHNLLPLIKKEILIGEVDEELHDKIKREFIIPNS